MSLLFLAWRAGDRLPRLPQEVREQAALLFSLRRIEPMLIGSVCLALRRATASTVEAAHGPAPHRGRLTPLARALRRHMSANIDCPSSRRGLAAPCRRTRFVSGSDPERRRTR